ncbi:MAG: hypothetical protein R3Y11_06235 [Pseudomonadota bacterium]
MPTNTKDNYSPELQDLLNRVEAALIEAGQKARKLAEQTGTELVIVERAASASQPHKHSK